MSVGANQLVEEARLTIPEISAANAHHKFQTVEPPVIVDVREPAEWEKGHIPGAIHAPRGLLEWLADPSYANHEPRLAGQNDKPIVVMCASGGRSLLAATTLRQMGYRDVCSMAGGFTDWAATGLPIETGLTG